MRLQIAPYTAAGLDFAAAGVVVVAAAAAVVVGTDTADFGHWMCVGNRWEFHNIVVDKTSSRCSGRFNRAKINNKIMN